MRYVLPGNLPYARAVYGIVRNSYPGNSGQPVYVVPSFSLHLWDGPTRLPAGKMTDLPGNAYSAFLDTGWESNHDLTAPTSATRGRSTCARAGDRGDGRSLRSRSGACALYKAFGRIGGVNYCRRSVGVHSRANAPPPAAPPAPRRSASGSPPRRSQAPRRSTRLHRKSRSCRTCIRPARRPGNCRSDG